MGREGGKKVRKGSLWFGEERKKGRNGEDTEKGGNRVNYEIAKSSHILTVNCVFIYTNC